MIRPPRSSTLFPYTTLFRSLGGRRAVCQREIAACLVGNDQGTRRHGRRTRRVGPGRFRPRDRKSTRLNPSHLRHSYAVFCFEKKKNTMATLAVLLILTLKQR